MTSFVSHTTVDSRDAYAQSVWWCAVLGYGEDPDDPNLPGHQECMIASPDGRGWVVLADPEGNEFCILRSGDELPPA